MAGPRESDSAGNDGSILGAPIAAMIYEATGSWMPVFGLVIGMDILTGLLALFVLRPLRRTCVRAMPASPSSPDSGHIAAPQRTAALGPQILIASAFSRQELLR
jgi:hypothetical protein